MCCKDFIITYLDLEKNNNIKNLMNINLTNIFELGEASTKISNGIDEIIEDDDDDDKDLKRINEIIKTAEDREKRYKIKDYIESKLKVKNFFPYEPKKYKREYEEKDNEEQKDIFYILKKLSNLNEKIKEYKKENKERCSRIGIEADENNELEEEMEID